MNPQEMELCCFLFPVCSCNLRQESGGVELIETELKVHQWRIRPRSNRWDDFIDIGCYWCRHTSAASSSVAIHVARGHRREVVWSWSRWWHKRRRKCAHERAIETRGREDALSHICTLNWCMREGEGRRIDPLGVQIFSSHFEACFEVQQYSLLRLLLLFQLGWGRRCPPNHICCLHTCMMSLVHYLEYWWIFFRPLHLFFGRAPLNVAVCAPIVSSASSKASKLEMEVPKISL